MACQKQKGTQKRCVDESILKDLTKNKMSKGTTEHYGYNEDKTGCGYRWNNRTGRAPQSWEIVSSHSPIYTGWVL